MNIKCTSQIHYLDIKSTSQAQFVGKFIHINTRGKIEGVPQLMGHMHMLAVVAQNHLVNILRLRKQGFASSHA